MIDDRTIESALTRAAAGHVRLDDATWRAVLPSPGGTSLLLFVRRKAGWVRLEVAPSRSAEPRDPASLSSVYRELLRRNRSLAEARFALNEDDDVVLEAVLDEAWDATALANALDAIQVAAQAHFPMLTEMS